MVSVGQSFFIQYAVSSQSSPPVQLRNSVDEDVDLRLLLFAHTLKRLHLRLKRLHAVRLLLKLLRLRVKRQAFARRSS